MGFLDALQYLGDTLDKPGRAVRGLLGGHTDELAAAIPFSDTFGLTDPGRAVTGTDLLKQLGVSTGSDFGDQALGFGVDVATDPLTYLGGAFGRLGGRAIGRTADAAAAARGPGYASGMAAGDLAESLARQPFEQIAAAFKPGNSAADLPLSIAENATERLRRIAEYSPDALREIPTGSKYLGAGDEAVAFRTPAGDVLSMSQPPFGTPGRPISPGVLNATRVVDYPNAASGLYPGEKWTTRVERLPYAEKVGDAGYWTRRDPGTLSNPIEDLRRQVENSGLKFSDDHLGNVGLVSGRPQVIDAGSVEAGAFAGPYQTVAEQAEPSAIMRLLLDSTGGRPRFQRALDAGRSDPGYTQLFGRLGLLGASAGAT